MALLVALLLAALVFSAFRAASGRPLAASGKAGLKPASRWLWTLGIVVLALVCLRFGLHWLAVAGGALFALLRTLGPLLPMFARLLQARQTAGAGGPGQEAPPPRAQRMTRQQALEVLGLSADATREDVQREYRRLMKKLHPDLGGSSYLAAQINAAKDALL